MMLNLSEESSQVRIGQWGVLSVVLGEKCWYLSVKLRKITSENRSFKRLNDCGQEVKASSLMTM